MLSVALPIEDIAYTTFQPTAGSVPQESLKITLNNGVALHIPNGDFTRQNPALCTMAFLGVTPSTMEDAIGEQIPVQTTREGEFVVAQWVVSSGQRTMDSLAWAPQE